MALLLISEIRTSRFHHTIACLQVRLPGTKSFLYAECKRMKPKKKLFPTFLQYIVVRFATHQAKRIFVQVRDFGKMRGKFDKFTHLR